MSSRLSFQTQLASIMEVLANAAVAEICKLVDDDYAVVNLQMSQCQRENKALKRKLHLLELKMARGSVERRLRDREMNNNRPRVHISPGDRLGSSNNTDGVFERQMDMGLWPGGAPPGDDASDTVLCGSNQNKSPDVELVESETLQVKEENMEGDADLEEDVALIGEDGVVERGPRVGRRTGLQHQEIQSSSCQTQSTAHHSQSQSQSKPQGQPVKTRHPGSSGGNRGVEAAASQKDVKVEVEPVTAALSIQQDVELVESETLQVKEENMEGDADLEEDVALIGEDGLVESSTDDYRGALPFDETAQNSTQLLQDLQESGRGFSEVSYGPSPVWTNGGETYCHDDSLPGPSTHCASISYMPSTLTRAEPGGSGRGLAVGNSAGRGLGIECSTGRGLAVGNSTGRGLAVENSHGFHSAPSMSFEQAPVIDLSEELQPIQVQGLTQAIQLAGQRLDHFLGLGQGPGGQGQGGYGTVVGEQKAPRKRGCMCKFCGKGFSSPANLESHLRTHTGERPYGCNICGKKFSQFWNLKIHRNIHTGERPYQCSLCPEKYADPSNLKKHQKRHHPQT